MKQRRKRKCADCGKPLGSTVGQCYECGGDEALNRQSREERLESARRWKLLLGVQPRLIEEAHEVSE